MVTCTSKIDFANFPPTSLVWYATHKAETLLFKLFMCSLKWTKMTLAQCFAILHGACWIKKIAKFCKCCTEYVYIYIHVIYIYKYIVIYKQLCQSLVRILPEWCHKSSFLLDGLNKLAYDSCLWTCPQVKCRVQVSGCFQSYASRIWDFILNQL